MSLIDRQWAGHWSSILMAPIVAPTAEEVRDLLARYFDEAPTAALAGIADFGRGVWVRVPTAQRSAFLERMVVSAPDPGPDDFDAYQLRHQAPVDWDQGTKIIVGPTTLLVCFNHAVGDAATFSSFATCIANLDLAGLRGQEPRATTSTIVRASARQGRSSSRRWVTQARARRTTQASAPSAPSSYDGPTSPSQQSVMVENHELAAVTAWGRGAHPTARLSSVLTSALYRALRAQGLPVDPAGFNTLIDVRRYLPEAERGIAGNLAKSLFVATADLADPTSVADAQAALLESGWPLPSLAVGALLAGVPGRGRGNPTAAPGDPMTLTMVVMSSLPGLSDIPWVAGGRGRYSGIGYPVGVDAVSVFAVRMPDHLEVALSYATEAIPDETAAKTLELLHDVPALFGG